SDRAPARHQVLEATEPAAVESTARAHLSTFSMRFVHQGDEPPRFLSLSIAGVTYHSRPPVITATLVRPDGRAAVVYRATLAAPRPGERAPYTRHADVPLRIAIDGEERALEAAAAIVSEFQGTTVPPSSLRGGVVRALFGTPAGDAG